MEYGCLDYPQDINVSEAFIEMLRKHNIIYSASMNESSLTTEIKSPTIEQYTNEYSSSKPKRLYHQNDYENSYDISKVKVLPHPVVNRETSDDNILSNSEENQEIGSKRETSTVIQKAREEMNVHKSPLISANPTEQENQIMDSQQEIMNQQGMNHNPGAIMKSPQHESNGLDTTEQKSNSIPINRMNQQDTMDKNQMMNNKHQSNSNSMQQGTMNMQQGTQNMQLRIMNNNHPGMRSTRNDE
eukprot:TRINITY_DN161_c0_g1_i1.p1 TRINITY_DN161_c0_g1~~TRINITY_DN161_c0_g1_i1.p1  ORF type:complete len:243 (+),score=42.66 TRINITY_DN161_c0_g1_i1:20-748(+)